ncbi:hypothetical protein PC116_g4374 [Phytophthora cactorum]|nr:hypothetical protein Pcac1_g13177 [Phytophthora cactorum]KAG4247864.1 hypothetical protein PC116_g4374 [Phytophthora cactorum]
MTLPIHLAVSSSPVAAANWWDLLIRSWLLGLLDFVSLRRSRILLGRMFCSLRALVS